MIKSLILFNFNKNDTGYFQYGLSRYGLVKVIDCGEADFKWDVENSKPYKMLRIRDIDYNYCCNCKELISGNTKYKYYFSVSKEYLYMKEIGTNNWQAWIKY